MANFWVCVSFLFCVFSLSMLNLAFSRAESLVLSPLDGRSRAVVRRRPRRLDPATVAVWNWDTPGVALPDKSRQSREL